MVRYLCVAWFLKIISPCFMGALAAVAVVDCMDDDDAVQQAGRSHLFGFAVALDLLEALHGFLADVPNPLGRSLDQFRMVFRLPSSLYGAQCFALAVELDLSLCQI